MTLQETPVHHAGTVGSVDLRQLNRWKKLVAVLSSTTLGLLGTCIFLGWRGGGRLQLNTTAALADPAVRDEIVERLAATSAGIWDSHNDPEVGRVLMPNLKNKSFTNKPLQTNSFGLRERDFDMPKQAGTLRVVLLGDSFVQGFGVEAQERMGGFLERTLRQQATGFTGTIECLHVGIGGWNILAECAYLRGMLTELAPDLVIQIVVSNDLDDHMGVRGFGQLSAFAPLLRERTDAMVSHNYPIKFSTPFNTNYLLMGADHESLRRYRDAGRAIGQLAALLRVRGTRYLVLVKGHDFGNLLWESAQPPLQPAEFTVLPVRLSTQKDLFHSPTDGHWSPKGHALVADLLFALIRRDELLPQLGLEPLPAVEEPALAELAAAREEALSKPHRKNPPFEGVSSLEPARFADLEWRHVYTGLDAEGQVSPYASFFLLKQTGQTAVRLRGRALPRPELAGALTRISVEGRVVGEHELVPGEPFDLRFKLPKGIKRRDGLNVRIETSDYGYAGPYQQHCISFVLEQLALE